MRTQSSRTRKLVFTATGRFHVHTAVFMSITPFSRFSRTFMVFSRRFAHIFTYIFGFHGHILFSCPHLVFTYTPSFSSSFGQTDFGHIFRVQMVCQDMWNVRRGSWRCGCGSIAEAVAEAVSNFLSTRKGKKPKLTWSALVIAVSKAAEARSTSRVRPKCTWLK